MNINVIKNTFKPTNTHSIFSDKYLHLTKKQNIVMDVIMIFFLKNYNKHLQSHKHKPSGDYQGPLDQMNNLPARTASLFLNTHHAKPMKETQKRAETFNKRDIYL